MIEELIINIDKNKLRKAYLKEYLWIISISIIIGFLILFIAISKETITPTIEKLAKGIGFFGFLSLSIGVIFLNLWPYKKKEIDKIIQGDIFFLKDGLRFQNHRINFSKICPYDKIIGFDIFEYNDYLNIIFSTQKGVSLIIKTYIDSGITDCHEMMLTGKNKKNGNSDFFSTKYGWYGKNIFLQLDSKETADKIINFLSKKKDI